MSKYDELCEAHAAAVERAFESRERCWNHIQNLSNGFVEYCDIPPDYVSYLRSNGLPGEQRRYTVPEDEKVYTLVGAITYEKEDGYWHIGVHIQVSPPNSFPERYVGYVLCVTEQNQKILVKAGTIGKARPINLNNSAECEEFYDEIVESIKESLINPQTKPSQIGFIPAVNEGQE